jgi:sugar lactone lactonase YvrE
MNRSFYFFIVWLLLPFIAWSQPAVGPTSMVATIAGVADTKGATDGSGTVATFNRPMGLAVDVGGNVYVADAGNMLIRKITPDHHVTTLAGAVGSKGSTNGQGVAARFFSPVGVAVGPTGILFVTDAENHTIRKITPDGVVTTVAGLAGSKGSTDGTGGAARFNQPHSLAIASDGSLYVTDTENHTIRKITPDGVVTTVAGAAGRKGSTDGQGLVARFYHPFGIAVDAEGTLYVADNGNCTIHKITAVGTVSTVAGTAGRRGSTDGAGPMARFRYPTGLAVATNGTLYVAEATNTIVRKITVTGEVSTLAGTAFGFGYIDGTGAEARFSSPSGVAVDTKGAVYVADSQSNTIRVIR